MNNTVAIKTLSTCRGCKYITASHECLDSGNCFEAKQMAIIALEKQIPMKPTGNYPFYCPVCEAKLMPDPHCGMCGQAIDWKEEEHE